MSKVVEYEIIKKINAGGMADIFLGVVYSDTGFQRLCAIKKLQPQYRGNARAEELFRKEAEICRKLNHSNITQVIDFDQIDGSDAIILEFINGTDVLSLLQICKKLKMKVSVGMAAYIGSELARGLHYTHNAKDPLTGEPLGVVHCDVSPANVLISYEGEVKLTDFGVAKSNTGMSELTANSLKGKLRYMSPEYLHSGHAEPRLDIYSLGVILWELLSGQDLFRGANSDEVLLLKLESVEKMRLSDHNENVDSRLEDIIRTCLHYDPVKRYKTAREVELDLSQYFHLRDPGFTPMKLGLFLQSIRSNDYREMQELIRSTLSRKKLPIKESASAPPTSLQTYFAQNQDTVVVPNPLSNAITKENRPSEVAAQAHVAEAVAKLSQPQPVRQIVPAAAVRQPVASQNTSHRPPANVQLGQLAYKVEEADQLEFEEVVYHEPTFKSALQRGPMDYGEWKSNSLVRNLMILFVATALIVGLYFVFGKNKSPQNLMRDTMKALLK